MISLLSVKPLSEFQRKQVLEKERLLDKADEKEKSWPTGKPNMGYNYLSPGFAELSSNKLNEMFNLQRKMVQVAGSSITSVIKV